MNSDCSLVGDSCFGDSLYLMIDEEQMLFYKPWNMRSDEERQEVIRIWQEQRRSTEFSMSAPAAPPPRNR